MSSIGPQHRHDFRPKLIALSVAACFSLSSTPSQANPTGGSVASGSASFATSGNTLTITNSAGAIINWANFSIGVNEITQFLQSSAASAVLNRVVGANGVIPQSVIDGILSSNGRVFLLNQSGILIGSTARIDVAGFVASSLNLSDQDFLNGRLNFTETPGAGGVSNAGVIETSSGGRVFLVAPDVQNSGIIRSPQGEIVLAAGKSVELVSEGSPFVTVNLTADSEQALNVGQLISDSGHIGMFGALVRQGGVIDANSAVAGANGEIRLVATKDLALDAGSVTTANGPSGGNVLLQAQGGTNLISGAVEAKGDSGQGGTIQALGVRVGVIGNGVIDASGDAGGGTVLVGGDQHGDNPNVQNAEQVLIGPEGVIRADAGTTGDGGRVIVWSDAETRVFGSISARGGSQSGNGGFVETSSRGGMDITGIRVDTRAANGQWGTWLLDPDNVIFEPNSYGGGGDPLVYGNLLFGDNPGTTAHITAGTVEGAFATNGTVQVQATNDIGFRTDLTLLYGTPGGLFEVRAQNNIDMAYGGTGPHTINTNGHDVVLSANDLGASAAGPTLNTTGTGSIIGGGNINASYGGGIGGNIALSGYGVSVGTLTTAGGLSTRTGGLTGNVTITALYGGVQTGNITTRGVNGADFFAGQGLPPTAGASGGSITISAAYGSVSTGSIDASGGSGGNGGYASSILVFEGASGGSGGVVTIGDATTPSITTGAITANGGAGGYGGSGAIMAATTDQLFQVGYGGSGGSGGIVNLTTSGNLTTTGAITLSGAAGGAGGSNIDATVTGVPVGVAVGGSVEVGFGGNGGDGGALIITGGNVSTAAIVATGGAGGAGGAGDKATANSTATAGLTSASASASSGVGGNGGSAGSVQITTTGNVGIAAISSGGGIAGAGGSGGSAIANASAVADAASANASGGSGGFGGSAGRIDIFSSGAYGNITIGDISSPGGTGGAAGDNSASASAISSSTLYGASATTGIGSGGNAGSSSSVNISGGAYGTVAIGTISTNGGAGGIANGGGSAQAFASSPAIAASAIVNLGSGGSGGSGGFVGISGNTVSTLAINTSSGSGADGAGAASASAAGTGPLVTTSVYGGNGGSSSFSGGIVSISGGTSVSTGPITTRGGNGGNGGATTVAAGFGGFGGDGAEGGSISLIAPVSVTVAGAIDATGGRGGAGGSSAAGYGGRGGAGGSNSIVSIFIDPDTVSVGSIAAAGGAGGNGGNGGIQGGNGGSGGQGAQLVEVLSLTYGGVAVGNIDASGASGGAGGTSGGGVGFYGGAGGAGGSGGYAFVFGGSINLLSGGTILAKGGSGGAGGAASAAGYGGDGGIGGNGGIVDLFAMSASGAFGTIQVGALNVNITGGLGGAGGATGGSAGANGADGSFLIFGNASASPPDTNTVTQAANSLLPADTAPSTEEIEKKNKESKDKKGAVCK